MKQTLNLGLNKPDGNDTVNIDVLNENCDKIDSKFVSTDEAIANIKYEVEHIDLGSVTAHVTAEHTTTKQHITNQHDSTKAHVTSQSDSIKAQVTSERVTVVGAVNSGNASIEAAIKTNSDMYGKYMFYESLNVTGIAKNETTLKAYNNDKGGIVRISPRVAGVNYITLYIDGELKFKDLKADNVFGRYSESGNSTGADGSHFEFPFNKSFTIIGGKELSTSGIATQQSYKMDLFYYINK